MAARIQHVGICGVLGSVGRNEVSLSCLQSRTHLETIRSSHSAGLGGWSRLQGCCWVLHPAAGCCSEGLGQACWSQALLTACCWSVAVSGASFCPPCTCSAEPWAALTKNASAFVCAQSRCCGAKTAFECMKYLMPRLRCYIRDVAALGIRVIFCCVSTRLTYRYNWRPPLTRRNASWSFSMKGSRCFEYHQVWQLNARQVDEACCLVQNRYDGP